MESLTHGFRQQFSDNISRLLQQEGSLLRKLVREEQMQHEVEYFDTIDPSEAFVRERRDNDPNNLDYDINNEIGGDKANVMLEPESFQVKDAAWALGRQYDRTILNALTAPVKTGRTGATTTHFPLDTQIVPLGVGLENGTNALIARDADDDILRCLAADNVSLNITKYSRSL